jgi:hypothetical protein
VKTLPQGEAKDIRGTVISFNNNKMGDQPYVGTASDETESGGKERVSIEKNKGARPEKGYGIKYGSNKSGQRRRH